MRFVSTRNPAGPAVSFEEAMFRGLAPDGGLYHPDSRPDLGDLFDGFDAGTGFATVAGEVTARLFSDEMSPEDARRIADTAFPFSPRLTAIDGTLSLLELYHGPSCAFKDFGASFLANAMEHFLAGRDTRAIILTATSGDTGSAVAQAFYRKRNIDVVILYPSGRVSPSQEKQLTVLGENIHALEVRGSFDDCQRMVKEAFVDPRLSAEFPLTSANSINLGRLLPQSFYYIWARAASGASADTEFYFTVPSGNFGNLTAGVLAWFWGLKVDGFIAATNANDVVPEYLLSGDYRPRPSIHTYANAMDVGNPSNFERLEKLFDGSAKTMAGMISGYPVRDEEILDTMRRYRRESGMFVCPHSATGLLSSERFRRDRSLEGGRIISLATAHPAKFSEISDRACGEEPPMPQRLRELIEREKRSELIGSNLDDLAGFLRRRF
jgi:threonine synthase